MSYQDEVRRLKPAWYSEGTDEDIATATQDALNGAALRLLQEALPWRLTEGGGRGQFTYELRWDPEIKNGHFGICIMDADGEWYEGWFSAATIAEAADSCREALG